MADETKIMSYSKTARILHWLIAFMILGLLAIGFLMGYIPKENLELRAVVYNMHKTFGMMILVLSIARLIWRLTHKPPALPSAMKAWEKLASKFTHIAFYVFMIGMPLVGWSIASTSRFPSMLFNKFKLPNLPFWNGMEKEAKHKVHEFFEETHEILAYIAVALIVLHVAAALKHHFKDKDDVLAHMIPSLSKKD